MKFRAIRPVRGDFGPDGRAVNIQPGQTFLVPDFMLRKLSKLEGDGVIERCPDRPRFDRKAYTVYENKALKSPEDKTFQPLTLGRKAQTAYENKAIKPEENKTQEKRGSGR